MANPSLLPNRKLSLNHSPSPNLRQLPSRQQASQNWLANPELQPNLLRQHQGLSLSVPPLVQQQDQAVRSVDKSLKSSPALEHLLGLEHRHDQEQVLAPAPPLQFVRGCHHAQVQHRANQPRHRDQHHARNWSASRFRGGLAPLQGPNVPAQAFLSAREVQVAPTPQAAQAGQGPPHALEATPWNWSENQSDAMEGQQEERVQRHQHDQAHPHVQGCQVACANRWHPASLCSSKSQSVVPPHLHHDDPMIRQAVLEKPQQRRHRLPAPLHQQHRAVLASDQVLPEANVVPDVPTGTTAPSWRHCGVVRPRSSVKKFTSLVKMTMH